MQAGQRHGKNGLFDGFRWWNRALFRLFTKPKKINIFLEKPIAFSFCLWYNDPVVKSVVEKPKGISLI